LALQPRRRPPKSSSQVRCDPSVPVRARMKCGTHRSRLPRPLGLHAGLAVPGRRGLDTPHAPPSVPVPQPSRGGPPPAGSHRQSALAKRTCGGLYPRARADSMRPGRYRRRLPSREPPRKTPGLGLTDRGASRPSRPHYRPCPSSSRSDSVAAPSSRLMPPLIVKKARFTRDRSFGRTTACSAASRIAVIPTPAQ